MPRSYLETNFLMASATGRDEAIPRFLSFPQNRIQLCLPEVCIMEAFSAMEDEQKRRNRLGNDLSQQISELSRSTASPFAASLRASLQEAHRHNVDFLGDTQNRMYETVAQLLNQRPPLAGAELLSIQTAYVPDAFAQTGPPPEIRNQPTDTLILRIICADALRHSDEPKAFLSGNTRDINNDEVHDFLALCDVRYFSTTNALMGWLDSGAGDFTGTPSA